jgi:hypothetical protein
MLDPDMSTPELCAAMRMERAIAFGEARRTELPKPKPTLTKAPGPHNDTKRHILTPAQIAEKEARADAAERTDAVRKNEKRKAERRAAGIAVRDRGPYRKAAN